MSRTATSQPEELERISDEAPRFHLPAADNTPSLHASLRLDAGDERPAPSDKAGDGFGSGQQGAGQPVLALLGQDVLPNNAERHLLKILALLEKQEERASKEAIEASLRRPFEQAAKTSLDGVSSGSLIAIFTAALDVALLSYVQDSLANDEITDNPPTSINLAVACFYTSMLLAVLAVAFYGLMAFKCYHDIHKTAKIARPVALTEDVPIAIYKKLQERYIPRGYRFLVKLTMSLRDKLAKLSERTELRGETDQPRTTLPALPDSSDGFPGRSSTPEDPKIEQQKIEADTWESTMVTVGTYKFTMVSQTWPSLFTLIVGLLLLAWAKHSGLVATITVTITGIFFADLLGTIANDASYLHPGELYGRTSLVFRLTLTLPFMCLAFCAGSIVLVLFLLGVITICVVGLLVFLLVSLIFGIVDICHSAYNLCTPCIRKKASSGSPEDGIPLDGNTLVLAGELSS